MKYTHNLIVSLCFFGLLAFEFIEYEEDVMTNPYMVLLNLFLGIMGGLNLGLSFGKFLSNRKKERIKKIIKENGLAEIDIDNLF